MTTIGPADLPGAEGPRTTPRALRPLRVQMRFLHARTREATPQPDPALARLQEPRAHRVRDAGRSG